MLFNSKTTSPLFLFGPFFSREYLSKKKVTGTCVLVYFVLNFWVAK